MSYMTKGFFWIGIYLALVLAPLAVLLLGPAREGSGFWWDLSLALGFAGTAMVGTLFFQTARFRRVSAPFGIDIIYYFHRQSSLVAFLFILAHPVILLILKPEIWSFLRPGVAPAHLWAALVSLLALALLITSSLLRKQFRIHYDDWRVAHAVLAVLALALAIYHIESVGHYVDTPWKKQLWGTFSLSWLALLVYVRLLKPWRQLRHPYRVKQVIAERGEAWTLEVVPEGHEGFTFQPGQFAWLSLGDSPFALKEHPFSISSSAENPGCLQFTIKALGDFTERIKETGVGRKVYLDGPHGAFSTDRVPAAGYVFIAGGIGIAPLMGMLRTFADRTDSRPLLLFYAYNTLERLTFREELEERKTKLDLTVVYLLKDPPSDWQGESGLISADVLQRHLPVNLSSREYFICGPVAMIHLSEKLLHRLGVPLVQIHSELFDLV